VLKVSNMVSMWDEHPSQSLALVTVPTCMQINPQPQPSSNILQQAKSLAVGAFLIDTGLAYKIAYTATGNLQVTVVASGAVLFDANTGSPNPGRAEMQVNKGCLNVVCFPTTSDITTWFTLLHYTVVFMYHAPECAFICHVMQHPCSSCTLCQNNSGAGPCQVPHPYNGNFTVPVQ
jgi:hypothetical protein